MSTNHIQPYRTFKIGKRDKECVLGIYRASKREQPGIQTWKEISQDFMTPAATLLVRRIEYASYES